MTATPKKRHANVKPPPASKQFRERFPRSYDLITFLKPLLRGAGFLITRDRELEAGYNGRINHFLFKQGYQLDALLR